MAKAKEEISKSEINITMNTAKPREQEFFIEREFNMLDPALYVQWISSLVLR